VDVDKEALALSKAVLPITRGLETSLIRNVVLPAQVTRLHATGLVIVTPAKRAGAWCVRAFAVLIRLSARAANAPPKHRMT
jgi:hypothetical protein